MWFRVKVYTCPISLASEMMIIGYSDGGGLGLFMNYQSVMVTKAVAIDFWNYNTYDTWLGQSNGITGGQTLDAVIYAACKSPFFGADGPKAVTPMAAHPSPALTYVEASGLSSSEILPWNNAGVVTTQLPLPCGTQSPCDWHNFKWASCGAKRKLEFLIHGLDATAMPSSAPTTAPDADSALWQDGNTGWCQDNHVASPVHTNVWDSIPIKGDVFKWLDSSMADFGCSGRRLSSGRSLSKVESYLSGFDYPYEMPTAFYDAEFKNEAEFNTGTPEGCATENTRDASADKKVVSKCVENDDFNIETEKAEAAYAGTDTSYKASFGVESFVDLGLPASSLGSF